MKGYNFIKTNNFQTGTFSKRYLFITQNQSFTVSIKKFRIYFCFIATKSSFVIFRSFYEPGQTIEIRLANTLIKIIGGGVD